ncbi:unnamed protein product [Sphagnum jensenii]|jgi:hypothetical protein
MRTSRSLAPTASRAALQETTVASSCIPSSIPQSVQVTIRDEKNLPKLVRHCNKKKFLAGFYLFKKARKLGTKNTNIFKQRRRTLRLVRKNPNRRWPGEERHLYFRRESSRRGRRKEGDEARARKETMTAWWSQHKTASFVPLTIFRIKRSRSHHRFPPTVVLLREIKSHLSA